MILQNNGENANRTGMNLINCRRTLLADVEVGMTLGEVTFIVIARRRRRMESVVFNFRRNKVVDGTP